MNTFEKCWLGRLPCDIALHSCHFFDVKTLCRLEPVCKSWKEFVEANKEVLWAAALPALFGRFQRLKTPDLKFLDYVKQEWGVHLKGQGCTEVARDLSDYIWPNFMSDCVVVEPHIWSSDDRRIQITPSVDGHCLTVCRLERLRYSSETGMNNKFLESDDCRTTYKIDQEAVTGEGGQQSTQILIKATQAEKVLWEVQHIEPGPVKERMSITEDERAFVLVINNKIFTLSKNGELNPQLVLCRYQTDDQIILARISDNRLVASIRNSAENYVVYANLDFPELRVHRMKFSGKVRDCSVYGNVLLLVMDYQVYGPRSSTRRKLLALSLAGREITIIKSA